MLVIILCTPPLFHTFNIPWKHHEPNYPFHWSWFFFHAVGWVLVEEQGWWFLHNPCIHHVLCQLEVQIVYQTWLMDHHRHCQIDTHWDKQDLIEPKHHHWMRCYIPRKPSFIYMFYLSTRTRQRSLIGSSECLFTCLTPIGRLKTKNMHGCGAFIWQQKDIKFHQHYGYHSYYLPWGFSRFVLRLSLRVCFICLISSCDWTVNWGP